MGLGLSLKASTNSNGSLVESASFAKQTTFNSTATTPTPSPHQASLLLSQPSANQNAYMHSNPYELQTSNNNQSLADPSAIHKNQQQSAFRNDNLSSRINPTSASAPSDYPLDHYKQFPSHQVTPNQQQNQQQNQANHPFGDFYDSLANHRRNQFLYPQLFGPNHITDPFQIPQAPSPPPLPSVEHKNEDHNGVLSSNQQTSQPNQPTRPHDRSTLNYMNSQPHLQYDDHGVKLQNPYDHQSDNSNDIMMPKQHHYYHTPNHHNIQPPILTTPSTVPSSGPHDANSNKQPVNLLAEPEQQQRHRQQMLDPSYLFGNKPIQTDFYLPHNANNPSANHPYLNHNQAQSYQQQPASTSLKQYNQNLNNNLDIPLHDQLNPLSQQLGLRVGSVPPYAHLSAITNPISKLNVNSDLITEDQGASSGRMSLILPNQNKQSDKNDERSLNFKNQHLANKPISQILSAASDMGSQRISTTQQQPQCSTMQNISTLAILCHEDIDYPTKEIMRALEAYASSNVELKSLEQLLPQSLIWMHLAQVQSQPPNTHLQSSNGQARSQLSSPNGKPASQPVLITLDSLQKNLATSPLIDLFPSNGYNALCKSNVFMSQPRRAKNISGQWKVIVNLPGHKYRGVAISQMVRVEECQRPLSECSISIQQQAAGQQTSSIALFASKSRCLQQYDNQRLLAWSQQQGLHMDIFRIPISCACHVIRV